MQQKIAESLVVLIFTVLIMCSVVLGAWLVTWEHNASLVWALAVLAGGVYLLVDMVKYFTKRS